MAMAKGSTVLMVYQDNSMVIITLIISNNISNIIIKNLLQSHIGEEDIRNRLFSLTVYSIFFTQNKKNKKKIVYFHLFLIIIK
jgi:hypothetical protein